MNIDGRGEHPLLPALQPADQAPQILPQDIDPLRLRQEVLDREVVGGNTDALGKPGDFVFPEAIAPKQFFRARGLACHPFRDQIRPRTAVLILFPE